MSEPDDPNTAVRGLIAAEEPVDEGAGQMVGWLQRLCRAAVRNLPASGAGISLMTEEGLRSVAAASDPVSEVLEELQFTLGEGPCIDAYASRRPVLEPALSGDAARRWPGYSAAAHEQGVRAVFAFPLQIGAARLGVLDVYREDTGSLSTPSLRQALGFAEVAVQTLLDGQERAPTGQAVEGLDQAMRSHYAVYQAQGMLMIELGVSLTDAMARMRAHAYTQGRPLQEVAREIVAGTLTLDRDDR